MEAALEHKAVTPSRIINTTLRAARALFDALFLVACGYIVYLSFTSPTVAPFRPFQIAAITLLPYALGLLISRRRPGHMIGRLFLVAAYSAAAMIVAEAAGLFNASLGARSSPPVETIVALVGGIAWVPPVAIPFLLMPLYFPTGRLLSPRWRVVVALVVFFQVWLAADTILRPSPVSAGGGSGSWNGLPALEPFFVAMEPVVVVAFVPTLFFILFGVYRRYRQSAGREREQMKWPALAFVLAFTLHAVILFVPALDAWNAQSDYVLTWLLTMLFPLAMGVAILGYRLWDIDIVVNAALVYGSLTLLIAAAYILLVGGLGVLFQTQTNTVSGLVATGIIALLFNPVRQRLQRVVHRLLYGDRDDPAAVVNRLAQELEAAGPAEALLPNHVQTIARTLKIPYVALWLPDEDGEMEPVAVHGRAGEHAQTLPLIYRQQTVGRLVVAPRRGEQAFSRQEQELLSTIAALTATTVHAVQLSDEVSRSRRRIVTAREDERRRLRRDLHDGLGPQLASQTLGLEAVSQLLASDPAKAQALLESLKQQAEAATLDVRRVVYDLRPPALDDLGLEGALRQSASRYAPAPPRWQFDLPAERPQLAAAVETAVYLIAQEAITNVVRHAQAARGSVRLFCRDGFVVVEVRDNGRGLPPGYHAGVGIQAMGERAAELNGELRLEPLPGGGTLVRARLPLEGSG